VTVPAYAARRREMSRRRRGIPDGEGPGRAALTTGRPGLGGSAAAGNGLGGIGAGDGGALFGSRLFSTGLSGKIGGMGGGSAG